MNEYPRAGVRARQRRVVAQQAGDGRVCAAPVELKHLMLTAKVKTHRATCLLFPALYQAASECGMPRSNFKSVSTWESSDEFSERSTSAVPLVALVVIGPMASAQETGQQPGMAGCPMMSQGTMGGPIMGRMMGQGRQGMMGPGMMGPGMSQDGGKASGMAGMFGSRVTPMMNLSIEDVRGHLGAQLDRLNNRRLKVGEVKADTGTISAEIVTVDNSLVQRLKVDRRTGAIDYQD